jgi:hypothetical protein
MLEKKVKQLREKYSVETVNGENGDCVVCGRYIPYGMQRYLLTTIGQVCTFDCLLAYDEAEQKRAYDRALIALKDLLSIVTPQYPFLNRKLKTRLRQIQAMIDEGKGLLSLNPTTGS